MAKIVVAGATLAWDGTPRGGHAAYVLQWLEGLRRCGHDVLYSEVIDGGPAVVDAFRRIVDGWWDPARCAAVSPSGEPLHGLDAEDVASFAADAAALVSLGATYRPEPVPWLEALRPRILIDQDPGFTHLWAGEVEPAEIYGRHDLYFTVGANVGSPRSAIATCGIEWHHTWNPVILEWWTGAPAGRSFTTVASLWSQSYQRFAGEVWGPKAVELARFIDLPSRVGQPLELALEAGGGDDELARLRSHGWVVRHAEEVAGSVRDYIDYVKRSAGEFSPVKGLYVGSRSGWFSDRSACYLAAGRPVVTQDTGLVDVLPLGRGLHVVGDVEEAAAAIRRIDDDYQAESRAAAALAAEHFDARTVVPGVLVAAGVS